LSQNPAYTGAATPYITYYAGLLTPNLALLLLVFWGWVLSFITLIQAYMVFIGRIMLAWADDGLLPEGMAYVHPHYRNPLVTLLVAAVLVQLGLVVFFTGNAGSLVARLSFFGAVTLLVPVTAVTFFPFLKKAWFQASPAFVQRKIGPLPVITLTGFLVMAYLVFLLIGPLLSVGGLQEITMVDLLFFGGMVLSGSIWYVSRLFHLRAHGVRLEELMRILPRGS
jgi:amino acid transporter